MGCKASNMDDVQVFLGGSCNPTTWRKHEAIPFLIERKITFYNPQVDDWSDDLIQKEEYAKENSKVLLFIIDNATRAIASMNEASFYIGEGRKVVLAIMNFEGSQEINGIQPTEFADLNRGRKYVRNFAGLKNIVVHSTVQGALEEIARTFEKKWIPE